MNNLHWRGKAVSGLHHFGPGFWSNVLSGYELQVPSVLCMFSGRGILPHQLLSKYMALNRSRGDTAAFSRFDCWHCSWRDLLFSNRSKQKCLYTSQDKVQNGKMNELESARQRVDRSFLSSTVILKNLDPETSFQLFTRKTHQTHFGVPVREYNLHSKGHSDRFPPNRTWWILTNSISAKVKRGLSWDDPGRAGHDMTPPALSRPLMRWPPPLPILCENMRNPQEFWIRKSRIGPLKSQSPDLRGFGAHAKQISMSLSDFLHLNLDLLSVLIQINVKLHLTEFLRAPSIWSTFLSDVVKTSSNWMHKIWWRHALWRWGTRSSLLAFTIWWFFGHMALSCEYQRSLTF